MTVLRLPGRLVELERGRPLLMGIVNASPESFSDGAEVAVSVAKAWCSDGFREVCNRGIQIHGGIGFTWEHNLHIYFRRSKASETLFGDAAFHRERIARHVVDGVAPVEQRSAEAVAVAVER